MKKKLPSFLVRMFDREKDYPMVEAWWKEHEATVMPLCVLPMLGVVVYRADTEEEVAVLWLYMDNSVGVCFAEQAVTRPKLPLALAGASLLRGLDFLKLEAAQLGYGVMQLRTYPGMARYAKKIGFVADPRPLVSMSILTTPVQQEEIPCP